MEVSKLVILLLCAVVWHLYFTRPPSTLKTDVAPNQREEIMPGEDEPKFVEAAPPPWLHEAEGDPIDNSPYEEVSNTLGIPIFFLSEEESRLSPYETQAQARLWSYHWVRDDQNPKNLRTEEGEDEEGMCGLEEESDDKSNNIIPETDDGYKVEGHWIWEDWAKEPGYRSMRVRVIEERACPMNCEFHLNPYLSKEALWLSGEDRKHYEEEFDQESIMDLLGPMTGTCLRSRVHTSEGEMIDEICVGKWVRRWKKPLPKVISSDALDNLVVSAVPIPYADSLWPGNFTGKPPFQLAFTDHPTLLKIQQPVHFRQWYGNTLVRWWCAGYPVFYGGLQEMSDGEYMLDIGLPALCGHPFMKDRNQPSLVRCVMAETGTEDLSISVVLGPWQIFEHSENEGQYTGVVDVDLLSPYPFPPPEFQANFMSSSFEVIVLEMTWYLRFEGTWAGIGMFKEGGNAVCGGFGDRPTNGVAWYDMHSTANSFEGRWAFDDDQAVEYLFPLDDDDSQLAGKIDMRSREYASFGKRADGTEYEGTVTITPLNLIENIFEFHWQLEDDDNTARTGLAYLSDGVLCVGYGNDINAGVVLYNFRDTQMRGQWTMFSNRNHRFQEYLIRSSNGGLDDPGMLLEMSYRSEVNSKEA